MDAVFVFVSLLSFAVSILLIWCAVTATKAVRRLADEASQIRATLRALADIEAARGLNEIASIQLTADPASAVELSPIPGTRDKASSAAGRASKIDSILRA